jgi:hypothetical protein
MLLTTDSKRKFEGTKGHTKIAQKIGGRGRGGGGGRRRG